MKKLLSIVLLFSLMISTASAITFNDYCGTWIYAMEMKGPYYSFDMLHLFADGTCFWCSAIVEIGKINDSDLTGRIFAWEVIENGIRVHYEYGYEEYYLTEEGYLSDGQPLGYVYRKVPIERWK